MITIHPSTPSTTDPLDASVATVDPEGEPIEIVYAWRRDGALTAHVGPSVPASATQRGERWALTAFGRDPHGDGLPATATVEIANSAPTVTSVQVLPEGPTTSDALRCIASAADADADPISFTYSWTIGGADAGTDPELAAGSHARGEVVTCTVIAGDGAASSSPVTAEVTIANAAPTASGVAISSERVRTVDEPEATLIGYEDADGDPEGAHRVRWLARPPGSDTWDVVAETAVLPAERAFRHEELIGKGRRGDGASTGDVSISAPSIVLHHVPFLTIGTGTDYGWGIDAHDDLIMWGRNVEGRMPGFVSEIHDWPYPVPIDATD